MCIPHRYHLVYSCYVYISVPLNVRTRVRYWLRLVQFDNHITSLVKKKCFNSISGFNNEKSKHQWSFSRMEPEFVEFRESNKSLRHKDSVFHMCHAGAVVASWSLTRQV